MKRHPVPQTTQRIVEQIHRMASEGATHEEMIATMRSSGLDIIPSIRLLAEASGIAWKDAKFAVHFSKTWSDWLDTNDAVHEAALEAARQSGDPVVERDRYVPEVA
jgi:hypothetical protein